MSPQDGGELGGGPVYTLAGWREWVSLPESKVEWIKAKLDTGARSSAIHAFGVEQFTRDERPWVRFSVHPWQDTDEDPTRFERPVIDLRHVRSSSGHSEQRLVVPLAVRLMDTTIEVEMTLSNRDEMGFRMLIGREALRQGFVVDPGRSYLGPRPPVKIRRRNRGR